MPSFICGSAAVSCEVPWGLDLGVRLVSISIFTAFVMISHHYQHIMCRFVHVWNKYMILQIIFLNDQHPSESIFHAATYKGIKIVVTPAR